MGVRWRGIWLSVIAMALPAVLSATAAASPETGLVASIDVVRGGAEHALPVDRRYLRLRPGDETLRVRLRAVEGALPARYRFRLEGIDAAWVETGWPAEHVWGIVPPGTHRLHVAAAAGAGWRSSWRRRGASSRKNIPRRRRASSRRSGTRSAHR